MSRPALSAHAQLADNLLNGQLERKLRDWRKERRSWDWIAKTIWDETDHQITVSGPTVSAWADRFGVKAPPAKKSEAA